MLLKSFKTEYCKSNEHQHHLCKRNAVLDKIEVLIAFSLTQQKREREIEKWKRKKKQKFDFNTLIDAYKKNKNKYTHID